VCIEFPKYTRIVNASKRILGHIFLSLVALFLPALLLSASPPTSHFEVYCDGVGIFLAKIDGAPALGKLVLFSHMSFPPGTIGGRDFGQGKWSDVFVYRVGCVPDGKCEHIALGKVWIDAWDTSDTADASPQISSARPTLAQRS